METFDNFKMSHDFWACSSAIILNFHRTTYVSLIQNKSDQQIFEKNKNNDQHEIQYKHFSLLSLFTNTRDAYA